ncbi:MAG TPA: exodeoxyribonuclease VII large subunit [Cyclobacteriaceae bacterium]|nr:exodeoxyribonuclease VII large subunit [Cyclobacteriaceae bacterium]
MQNPLSLSELNQLIRQTLDSNLSPNYWIIAEIGELRDSVKGHAYLELVEKSGNYLTAKIKANIWSYTYQGIRHRFMAATGQSLSPGMKILALVNVQFHEIYGLSVVIKDIDPNYTVGERAKRKQQIIERLTREGLIHLNKQYPLPLVPQRLAVISSATAAGYGDFTDQLAKNQSGYKVYCELYPATMQGNEASASIINAIAAIEADLPQKQFDLLIIIRGGGATTDMDCFDDYDMAKAIANTTLPVVTGIGHERDECIADLVANTKMKTPTAVAEFVIGGFRAFEERLNESLTLMERKAGSILQREEHVVRDKEHLLSNLFLHKIAAAKEKLANYSHQINSVAVLNIKMQHLALENFEQALKKNVKSKIEQHKLYLQNLEKELRRLSPQYFLEKGYTRTEVNGVPLYKVAISKGDILQTYTLNQKITSIIDDITEHEQ